MLDCALYHMTSNIFVCTIPDLLRMTQELAVRPIGDRSDKPVYTWKCAKTHFFSLIQYKEETYAYCHTNDMMYTSSIMAKLCPSCPDKTVFFGQFTFDNINGKEEPRFLVFDMVTFKSDAELRAAKKRRFPASPPEERMATLRAASQYIPHPLCCVQWVGLRKYLTAAFIRKLPHEAESILMLSDSPLIIFSEEKLMME